MKSFKFGKSFKSLVFDAFVALEFALFFACFASWFSLPLVRAAGEIEPVPTIATSDVHTVRVCPIDMPNCCDVLYPPDSAKCCPIKTKEYYFENDLEHCQHAWTNCRYSDTGELDKDCCSRFRGDPECCEAFPEYCEPTPLPTFEPDETPAPTAETLPQVNARRDRLTTDEGRQAYDAVWNALESGAATPEGISSGAQKPAQSVYDSVAQQSDECSENCKNQARNQLQSQANAQQTTVGYCDSYAYPRCMAACTIQGNTISCPRILRGCPQVIQDCQPVPAPTQSPEDAEIEEFSLWYQCREEQCSGYRRILGEINQAGLNAVYDWQAKQDKERIAAGQMRPTPTLKPTEKAESNHGLTAGTTSGVETSELNEWLNDLKEQASVTEAESVVDARGKRIPLENLKAGVGDANPVVEIGFPPNNLKEGVPVSELLPQGLPLEEMILTPSNSIDGAKTMVTFFDASKPELLGAGAPPQPDPAKYELKSYFKVGTVVNEEETHPFKEAVFKFFFPLPESQREKTVKSALSFMRYNDAETVKTWYELPLEKLKCNSAGCEFVAKSPGTSYFAVVEPKKFESTTVVLFVIVGAAAILVLIGLSLLIVFAFKKYFLSEPKKQENEPKKEDDGEKRKSKKTRASK